MFGESLQTRNGRRWPTRLLGATAIVLLASVGACSSVPDAMNPVEWYKDTVDFFSGDEEEGEAQAAEAEAQDPPGADKPYPNLGEVPARETARTKDVAEGLVADTQRRRYSDEVVARQGEAVNPLDKPAPLVAAAPKQAASPGAMPKSSVAAAAMTAPKAASAPPSTAKAIVSRTPPAAPKAMAVPKPRAASSTQMAAAPRNVMMPKRPSLPPANALVPGNNDPFATVVVSSDGVETMGVGGYGAAPGVVASGLEVGGGIASSGQTVLPAGALRVATIQFSNGSANLSANDRRVLRQVRDLQRSQGGKLQIIGHASSRTRDMDLVRHKMVNFKVSADRANSVARELTRLGVAATDIVIGAVADAAPAYYEIMPSGEAGNRRAEVFLIN